MMLASSGVFVPVRYLLVGGGGSGHNAFSADTGGGGEGGEVVSGTVVVNAIIPMPVAVGPASSINGNPTTWNSITAVGGLRATSRLGASGGPGANGGAGAFSGTATPGDNGPQNDITGTMTYYAGGGGGGGYEDDVDSEYYPAAQPGLGVFGRGGVGSSNWRRLPGPTSGYSPAGGGEAGAALFRYAGPPLFTGGTITTVGTDTLHTFTASGTLQPI